MKQSAGDYLKRNLFTPPYPLLPLLAYTLLLLCFILHPNSVLHNFRLGDPDDYMRLNQVINWLGGQGWYDFSHPRLSPDENVTVYWSRLVDLPLTAIALPLIPLIGKQAAVMVAALIVPPALLGLLMFPVVSAMVRPLVPRYRANLAAVMIIFAMPIIANFTPGRVDHHGYQIIICGFGFLALLRSWVCPQDRRSAAWAGLVFACGLWIGGEVLPGLILFSLCLGLLAACKGGLVLRNAAIFGISLPLTTAIILPLARKPSEWGLLEMTWFSPAYVIFAALLGSIFIIGWALGRHTTKIWLRLALFAALGFMAAGTFFTLVPRAIDGPYADLETLSYSLILDNVGEAQPLARLFHFDFFAWVYVKNVIPVFMHYLLLPCLAVFIVLWQSIARKGRRRVLWLIQAAFLLPMLLLTLFWQMRVYTFMALFTIPPITWLCWHWLDRIGKRFQGRSRFWLEILAFGSLGFFPIALIPGVMLGKPLLPDILLFPIERPVEACDLSALDKALSDPEIFGDRPRVIMTMINEGPELLFRTPHLVLSAPYNVKGNRDVFDFFTSRDEDQALKILQRHNAELVVLCRNIPPFYAGINKQTRLHVSIGTDKAGNFSVTSDKNHPTISEKLLKGEIPAWLKPVEVLFNKDYLLFEIKP